MSGPATDQSALLLESILQTLKQINKNMSAQKRQWESLNEVFGTSSVSAKPKPAPRHFLSSIDPSRRPGASELAYIEDIAEATEGLATSISFDSDVPQKLPRIRRREPASQDQKLHNSNKHKAIQAPNGMFDYRSWRSPLEDSPLQRHLFLTEKLGDAWTVPDDGRVPLSFSREVLEELRTDQLRDVVSYIGKFRDKMARSNALRFNIVDYDNAGGHIVYRLGERAVTGKQEFRPLQRTPGMINAPWRRFVLCQGLNTAQANDHDYADRRLAASCWDQAPFLLQYDRFNTRSYFLTAVEYHLRGARRDSYSYRPNNLYETSWESFHITFYEAPSVFTPKVTKDLPRGRWRHGSLYGSEELDFCESALTLIAVPSIYDRPPQLPAHEFGNQRDHTIIPGNPCSAWSIVLLAPVNFFDSYYFKLPLSQGGMQGSIGERSMEGATIHLLEATYRRLHYNWRLFRTHFEVLIDEGDALLKPALHDKLLWDDETFSRSRRYAWAITCLTEFERSIGDNIMQWKDFKSARLDHLLQARTLTPLSEKSVEHIDNLCVLLEGLQQYFSLKLASTRALRDGDKLFNASTVIESRTSTRLSENIRLLTFVSIFFNPLTFCTSLWSINNTFSSTALIYTSVIVGVSTYIIVFHLNSLVHHTSTSYTPIRNEIISRMRNHNHGHWATKGKRFATFQPKHERLRPSEWWILLFWIQTLFTLLYRFLLRKPEPEHNAMGPSPEVLIIGDEDGALSKGPGTSTHMKVEASSAAPAESPLKDNNQPPGTKAQSQEGSLRKLFPFQIKFPKKLNPSPRPSSVDTPALEEV